MADGNPTASVAGPPPIPGMATVASLQFMAISCLLFVTASLKLVALISDRFADIRIGMPIYLIWLVFLFEIAVGMLLISSRVSQRTKWYLAFGTFSIFLVISLFKLIGGVETCGCAGLVEMPPSVSVLVNGCVLVTLLIIQSCRRLAPPSSISTVYDSSVLLGILAGTTLFLAFRLDLPNQMLSPQHVKTTPVVLKASPPLALSIDAQLENVSDSDIEIVGFTPSCSCMDVIFDHCLIKGKSAKSVKVLIALPELSSSRSESIDFFLKGTRQSVARLDVLVVREDNQ